jgi:hypothetical protein
VVGRLLDDPRQLDTMNDEQHATAQELAAGLDALRAAAESPVGPVSKPVVNARNIVRRVFNATKRAKRVIPWGSILGAFDLLTRVSCLERRRLGEGGVAELSRFFHTVRGQKLPDDKLVIISDATADPELVELVVGDPVREITPGGRLADRHRVRQIPRDVSRKTSAETVIKLIAGRLAAHPEWKAVGIICLLKHRAAVEAWVAAGGELAGRVRRVAHYGEGAARGSNVFIEGAAELGRCDALLVVGTPRQSPDAIRMMLHRMGDTRAAVAAEPDWVPLPWVGLSETGERVTVPGKGYADPQWERWRRWGVRAAIRQAVGRGRGQLADGIPCELLSTEEAGVELADVEATGLAMADGPRRVLDIMSHGEGEKLDTKPTNSLVGKLSNYGPVELSAELDVDRRTALRWLKVLERRGLVVCSGGRGRAGGRWRVVVDPATLPGAGGGASPPGDPPELGELPDNVSTSAAELPVVVTISGIVPELQVERCHELQVGPPSAESTPVIVGPPPEPSPVAAGVPDAVPVVAPLTDRPWTCRNEPWANEPRSWVPAWQAPPPVPAKVPELQVGPPVTECWWAKEPPPVDRWWAMAVDDPGDERAAADAGGDAWF